MYGSLAWNKTCRVVVSVERWLVTREVAIVEVAISRALTVLHKRATAHCTSCYNKQ